MSSGYPYQYRKKKMASVIYYCTVVHGITPLYTFTGAEFKDFNEEFRQFNSLYTTLKFIECLPKYLGFHLQIGDLCSMECS